MLEGPLGSTLESVSFVANMTTKLPTISGKENFSLCLLQ